MPGGPLAEFECPYEERPPTNIVHLRNKVSHRTLDWLLITSSTSRLRASASTLMGLSTHRALLVDLHIPTIPLQNVDTLHGPFDFQRASDEQLETAGNLASLVLWWTAATISPLDSIIQHLWWTLRWVLPPRLQRTPAGQRSSVPTMEPANNDQSTIRCLHLPADALQSPTITSATSRALRINPSKASPVDSISPDGITFPVDQEAFLEEIHRQAQDLYSSRCSVTMDQGRLQLAMQHRRPSSDAPDYRTIPVFSLCPTWVTDRPKGE
jgi:hypothetical protein